MDLRRLYNELASRERDWDPWNDVNHRDRLRLIVDWATEVLPNGGRVLDAGCAHGEIAAAIAKRRPDADVVGVDIADVWVEEAQRRHGGVPNVRFERADVRDLPFEDDSFDVVICAEVLEHLPGNDWRRAVRELDRVSRDVVIVSIPDDREPDGTYHVQRLTPDDVAAVTERQLKRLAEIPLQDPHIVKAWVMLLR